MNTWTTDAVEPRDRFSFWQDVVCQTILNVSTEARPDHFQARISGRTLGALRFAAFDSSSHKIVRSQAHLASSPADHYLISLQLRGRCEIAQDHEAFLLEPGEIAVVDGQKPFQVNFPNPISRVLAVIPKKALDERAPWLHQIRQPKIPATSAFADLTRHHLLQLARGDSDLDDGEARLLTENLCNLLALSFARDIPPDTLQPELQLTALLAFCRQNLSDARLSPSMVATHFGMSPRTLHLRFQQIGQTFGRWVLNNRLEWSRRALSDSNQKSLSISEIAYRCGFNDLSHFNKSFRAKFDQTPRELRNRLSAAPHKRN